MDGNRRFAKRFWLSALSWHASGFENAKNILKTAGSLGIEYLTLWALSKENLEKREPQEVAGILSLIEKFMDLKWDLMKHSIRFETIGDLSQLPEKTQKILENIRSTTARNTGLVLTIALVYSGQDEIIRGIKLAQSVLWDLSNLTQEQLRSFLDIHFLPTVDLIIRTWGDMRHSWFLLFDSAYSEYYFTHKYWPEFTSEDFREALDTFHKSKRNFGK